VGAGIRRGGRLGLSHVQNGASAYLAAAAVKRNTRQSHIVTRTHIYFG
jgi:hypothetical protein